MSAVTGDGILYENLSFDNWKGTAANGVSRAPINAICPSGTPCTNISITNFAIWTEAGSSILYKCANAYGSGGCLNSGSKHTTYTSTSTIKSAP
jgi:rhamnogalacturonan hydrolase